MTSDSRPTNECYFRVPSLKRDTVLFLFCTRLLYAVTKVGTFLSVDLLIDLARVDFSSSPSWQLCSFRNDSFGLSIGS